MAKSHQENQGCPGNGQPGSSSLYHKFVEATVSCEVILPWQSKADKPIVLKCGEVYCVRCYAKQNETG